MKRGGFGTRFEERDIERPFAAVFADLSRHAEACLNTSKTGSTPSKYGPVASTVYYGATAKRLREDAGEVVVVQGDIYIQVVDAEARGDKSHVTVYGFSVRDELFEVFFAWAEGKNAECPDL